MVQLLIGHGAEFTLYDAVVLNDRELAHKLIDRGAEVNAEDDTTGRTPLHYAVEHGAFQAAQLLLDRGADIEARDDDGSTPLHWAAYHNALDVAQLLLDRGAYVNAKEDYYHYTPLDYALENDHEELQAILRRHGGKCVQHC